MTAPRPRRAPCVFVAACTWEALAAVRCAAARPWEDPEDLAERLAEIGLGSRFAPDPRGPWLDGLPWPDVET